MDTSEIYVKMVDCPEIQDRKPKVTKNKNWLTKEDVLIDIMGNYWSTGHHQVYLPRQDQIQEMYGWIETSIPNITLAMRFAEFCDTHGDENVDIRKGSMEQLWLAFYMWENHQKIWDGEKWVKSAKE